MRDPKPTRSVVPEPGRRTGQGASSIGKHLENDKKRSPPVAGERDVTLARAGHSILVVDDAHAARYAGARVLSAAGYKTIEAGGGAEALRLAPGASAVVLDVHLPDIHGFEVCRLLRADPATAALPVVHVSAVYVSEEDRRSGQAAGADAYLVAPVSTELLVGTVDKLLGIATDQAD